MKHNTDGLYGSQRYHIAAAKQNNMGDLRKVAQRHGNMRKLWLSNPFNQLNESQRMKNYPFWMTYAFQITLVLHRLFDYESAQLHAPPHRRDKQKRRRTRAGICPSLDLLTWSILDVVANKSLGFNNSLYHLWLNAAQCRGNRFERQKHISHYAAVLEPPA